ncbi:hypothetical protein [Tepidimonas sp.]|uniref:hypothetical protein n=1 Tax=Tepidimonas sp. TaxID=2002775 RepID=UPI002FE332C2
MGGRKRGAHTPSAQAACPAPGLIACATAAAAATDGVDGGSSPTAATGDGRAHGLAQWPMPQTTPHHQPCPGARTGFVFICPGRFEAQRGYPCAAGTGANLARVLLQLHQRDPLRFPSPQRADYVITNAWARVEYPALTRRSVPTLEEVLEAANLQRLAHELAGLHWVVACGVQAHAAVRALHAHGLLRAAIACERHLSQRSINGIRDAADTATRLARWCDGVLAQFGA